MNAGEWICVQMDECIMSRCLHKRMDGPMKKPHARTCIPVPHTFNVCVREASQAARAETGLVVP